MVLELDRRCVSPTPDEKPRDSTAKPPSRAPGRGPAREPTASSPPDLDARRSPDPEVAVRRALAEVSSAGPEFVPDPEVVTTGSGGSVVYLHQYHRGVPIFEATRTVRLGSAGEPQHVTGNTVDFPQAVDLHPAVDPESAVRRALAHVSPAEEDLSRTPSGRPVRCRTLASFATPSRPTVVKVSRLRQPVTAHLVIFHGQSEPDPRLGWLVSLTTTDGEEYDLVVTAEGGAALEVLYCKGSLHRLVAGEVYRTNPDEGEREVLEFPRPGDEYPDILNAPTPVPGPRAWVDGRKTRGQNVSAFRGNGGPVRGSSSRGNVLFAPADDVGREQQVVNAFYFCNFLHDFFYRLGFTEARGNFQRDNPRGVPGGRDALEVRVFDQVLTSGASMRTRQDGRSPELNLGLLPGSQRPTALDAAVVFHEFVHGVTTRLVGGPMRIHPLAHEQSQALAEGYSDYFALTLQNYYRTVEQDVLGTWVANSPGGLRRNPYDEAFPGHFGLLGRDEYREPHHAGEVWAATLVSVNRRLGRTLASRQRGHVVGWLLVMESLSLLPADANSPSFLDARDALVDSVDDVAAAGHLDASEVNGVAEDLRQAFHRFGMGPLAQSPNASYQGVVADL